MKMSSVFTALRMQGALALFVRYVSSPWYGREGGSWPLDLSLQDLVAVGGLFQIRDIYVRARLIPGVLA